MGPYGKGGKWIQAGPGSQAVSPKNTSTTARGGGAVTRLTVTIHARETVGPTKAGQMPPIQLSKVPYST